MNQTELMIAIGGGLFAAFLLGWLAGWLTLRAAEEPVPAPPPGAAAEFPEPPRPAADSHAQDDMAARLVDARDAAFRAQDELRLAQIEIEELRSYIERKLAPSANSG
ncbi:hypothetical protein [Paracoccus alkenifer]|uniref:Uncharacterized protein n=1 Tax=Paracoccus alkenifer TaxID=65735 RepID=A0A1H6MDU2_9RHOB|nr:hypothetical protein [Paracoccus alkenifer]SEH95840.1 hypothetical protein SAMN04488075_1885 [Paracoccus alkenifer]